MSALDPEVERLAQRIATTYAGVTGRGGTAGAPAAPRLLVALAGRPGCGKSTIAVPLVERVNALIAGEGNSGQEVCVGVGLDGWHYSRAKLDAFDDAKEAHWRRGAAFTFDLPAYAAFVAELRWDDGTGAAGADAADEVSFPTFDHAAKDPVVSPRGVRASHRIVVLEGLYTMYDVPGWRDVAAQMDMRVWIDVPRATCFARVLRRNLAAGIVADEASARVRVEQVDMANGDDVAAHKYHPTDEIRPADSTCSA